VKAALAQIDTTAGDIAGNLLRIRLAYAKACERGADLVVFPELAVPGYPSGDLLCQGDFIRANLKALDSLARSSGKAALLVGYAEPNRSGRGKPLFNAAALLRQGRIAAKRFKTLIPTYDVFDEGRYFEAAPGNEPVLLGGRRIGVSVCEDAWNDPDFWARPLYGKDPVSALAKAGAEILVNLSASPFSRGKPALRLRMLKSHARKTRKPFLFCNLVGGNDELVFDGGSLALDAQGRLRACGRAFADDLVLVDLDASGPAVPCCAPSGIEEVYRALLLGLKDYARKCRFREAVVGLSGGIDSALVCTLAADALGAENVTGVLMPSRYSSKGSVRDALALAKNLGVAAFTVPIEPMHAASLASLRKAGLSTEGLVEQNLQARLRGLVLMAFSNATGALLLSTGNKSESSVGYCTLYGDMAGGLSLISDLPKTTVYELSRFLNRERVRIPTASLAKAPSAELKPGQKDQDDLPPYETLDDIMRAYVEEGAGLEAIVRRGHLRALVERTLERIDRAEFKRRQAAPGIKITVKAFGVGRRMPVARGQRSSWR